jgi:tRNA(Ile)-lysidine synthase
LRVISEPAAPLGAGAFARLMAQFDPFEASPVLAVGVSGGRDSLALALLAQHWAAARSPKGQVVGLIVDHGLRQESAAEALATQQLLTQHGIEAVVLAWLGAKPQARVQEAARSARYRLLHDECRRRGILHLLLAHHAADQAETVAMRAAHRSGPDGLAGMAALVERPEVRLLRPLLRVPRARLTATLIARGVQWLDDPSNEDLRFERARLRAGPPLTDRASAAADRAARERALAQAAVEVLEFDQEGMIAIDCAGFAGLTPDLQARLLSRVVQCTASRRYAPRQKRLNAAVQRLRELSNRGRSGRAQDFTLSGCRLMLRQQPHERRLRWIVRPENGRNMGQTLIPPAFFACFACGAPAASHLE